MKTVAIIEKNRCQFDRMEEFVVPLLYKQLDTNDKKMLKKNLNDYIWSVISPYVKFVNVSTDTNTFIEDVCQNMTECFPDHKADEFYYHTESSYSSPKKFLEIVYCQPLWSDYMLNQTENMNNIACLFSLKHTVVENTCVIMANTYDPSKPNFTTFDSITKADILRVIRRRFYFSAILIKDKQLVKYYYQNVAYLIQTVFSLNNTDTIEKMAFAHFKYNILLYFQHDKTKPINPIATRINGMYQLHGNVLVIHEMDKDVSANISINEIKRLNVLSYGKLIDRDLRDNEDHAIVVPAVDNNGKKSDKKSTPFWSRYVIINNRMAEWKKKTDECVNCHKDIAKPVVCDKCFRIKYCSEKCRDEYSYHTKDCINPKSL